MWTAFVTQRISSFTPTGDLNAPSLTGNITHLSHKSWMTHFIHSSVHFSDTQVLKEIICSHPITWFWCLLLLISQPITLLTKAQSSASISVHFFYTVNFWFTDQQLRWVESSSSMYSSQVTAWETESGVNKGRVDWHVTDRWEACVWKHWSTCRTTSRLPVLLRVRATAEWKVWKGTGQIEI